jgi:hypothetical protein
MLAEGSNEVLAWKPGAQHDACGAGRRQTSLVSRHGLMHGQDLRASTLVHIFAQPSYAGYKLQRVLGGTGADRTKDERAVMSQEVG